MLSAVPGKSTPQTDAADAANPPKEKLMSDPQSAKSYPLEEALRAQKSLREMAGLKPEMFPLQAFIGMISDEVEILRGQGRTDEEIAKTISANSSIDITPAELAEHYAPPEQRRSTDH